VPAVGGEDTGRKGECAASGAEVVDGRGTVLARGPHSERRRARHGDRGRRALRGRATVRVRRGRDEEDDGQDEKSFHAVDTAAGPPEVRLPYESHGPLAEGPSYGARRMAARRDERALVRGAQRGSASDFEALFRAHWPRAYRAAYLVVHDGAAAEDIAQEAFLAAVRALDRFDRRRPFGPWLHRIVVNRAIDWARARELRRESELVDVYAAAERAVELEDETIASLARLSPEHRAVIVLRHLLEYTPGEIADLLGLPRGTVNSRLRRGLDSLKEWRDD
jgi:RNA polymerase sigma-70 factor, ECF subfamily